MIDDDDITGIEEGEFLTPVQRLSRDLANASVTLSDKEARFLVDAYYSMQEDRIRHEGQIRSVGDEEPHTVLSWLKDQSKTLEGQIKRALDRYSAAHPDGDWLRSVVGIGPVIAAGLLAHIDITQAPTVGHIWAFAGLDPSRVWAKGEKRPHNASLKVLCWKAGQSFMKNAARDGCVYGKLYQERKKQEVAKNEALEFAGQAAIALEKRRYGKDTEAYKAYIVGKLPPAHVDARARRWAVKLFLAHLHDAMYRRKNGVAPPLPYPIAHLHHAHVIGPDGNAPLSHLG